MLIKLFQEELKDTQGAIRIVNRTTDNTMAKGTDNNLQNITQKTKVRVTRSPLKTGCFGR
jgi:hypothetical protein